MALSATTPIKTLSNDTSYIKKREQQYKSMVRAHAMLGVTNAIIYSYSDDDPCKWMHIATSFWACKRIWSLQNEQLSNRKIENEDKFDELQYSHKYISGIKLALAIRFVYGAYANTDLIYRSCHSVGTFFYGLGSFVHIENLQQFKKDLLS